MRYTEFRDVVRGELTRRKGGLTWRELKERLDLPYAKPCPTWVRRMEIETGLRRNPGPGRAYVWTIPK